MKGFRGQNFWNPLTITYNRFKKVFNQIVRKMKKKRIFTNILAMALVLIVVIVVVITVGLFRTGQEETLEGQAETTDYRLSSKVPARVLEIRVKEGDLVHRGDTLVVLEAPDVEAKLSQANAAYSAAKAMEEKAHNGARQEDIQAAYEMWQKAKAAVDVSEKTYNRVQRLLSQASWLSRSATKRRHSMMPLWQQRKLPRQNTTWPSMEQEKKTRAWLRHKLNVLRELLQK